MENPGPTSLFARDTQPMLSDRDQAVLFLDEIQRRIPRPYVTWALMAANVTVFVVMVAAGVDFLWPIKEDFRPWGADYGPLTTSGEWWRMFTAIFVHFGIIHVGMNTFVLFQIGPFIERLVGHVGMFVVYAGAGLFGSLASLAYRPENIGLGASGAVFGLFGVLLGFLLRQRRTIPSLLVKGLLKSALYFVGFNLLISFSLPLIDNSAHIGGLVGGCILGVFIAQPITHQGDSRRIGAAALTAIVGGALVVGLAGMLPRTIDINREWYALVTMANTTSTVYGDAVDRRRRGTMSDAALAEKIENEILPKWRAAQEHFGQLHPTVEDQQRIVGLARDYIAAQLDTYDLTARALRTRDESLNQEAKRRADDAKTLFVRIEQAPK